MAQGRVRVDPLITHRFAIGQALQAYDLILNNREFHIGVLLSYSQEEAVPFTSSRPARKVWLSGLATRAAEPAPADRRAVGLIGGGLFTRNILLPALKQVRGVRLVGAATTSGATSQHLAKKYGFAYATTDYREVLCDPTIASVLITTRHDSHARLAVEALAAGKHVFVEKPLCLTEEELEEIRRAYNGSRLLMVGFNRRFAPLARKMKALVANRTTPLVMVYRVNAGYLSDDHWVHDPESGGGRLLGEVCHFIDFLQFLCDARAVQASVALVAGALGKYRADDNLSLTLRFADGSLGTIIYTAKGSKAFSRERVEVFCEESVAVIEDFRRAQVVEGGRVSRASKFSMDRGYLAEMEFFFTVSGEEGDFGELFAGYAEATLTALKAQEALLTGKIVTW
jgi:predicted dehydrogenase